MVQLFILENSASRIWIGVPFTTGREENWKMIKV